MGQPCALCTHARRLLRRALSVPYAICVTYTPAASVRPLAGASTMCRAMKAGFTCRWARKRAY